MYRLWPLFLVGCLPTFDTVECFDDTECSAGAQCIEQRCQLTLAPDAGSTDGAHVDAARLDASLRDATFADVHLIDGARPDAAPPPEAELVGHWTFSRGAERADTTRFWDDLELYGSARIADGALYVDGINGETLGFARASSWGAGPIEAKTYVTWVAMRGQDAYDGAAFALYSSVSGDRHSLAWGHNSQRAWSVSFNEGRPDARVFRAPHLDIDVTHQIAASWRPLGNGQVEVVLCRNGVEAGRTTVPDTRFENGAVDAVFGTAALPVSQAGRWTVEGTPRQGVGAIEARIDEVRLYRGALGCAAVGGLAKIEDGSGDPPPRPTTELIGQWSFTPGAERVDSTGNWDDLEVHGTPTFQNGQLVGPFGNDHGFARAVGWRDVSIRDKTLVLWVENDTLELHGGGVGVDTRVPRALWYDALAHYTFAEGHFWTYAAGPRELLRFGLRGEDARVGVMRQVAMVWKDAEGVASGGELTLCIDGERIGRLGDYVMADWRTDAQVVFGIRYLTWQAAGRWQIDGEPQFADGGLDARFDEVQLYRGALTCDEVRALQPAP